SRDWSSDVCSSDLHGRWWREQGTVAPCRCTRPSSHAPALPGRRVNSDPDPRDDRESGSDDRQCCPSNVVRRSAVVASSALLPEHLASLSLFRTCILPRARGAKPQAFRSPVGRRGARTRGGTLGTCSRPLYGRHVFACTENPRDCAHAYRSSRVVKARWFIL